MTPAVSGSPSVSERGSNNRLQANGQGGYMTLAISGSPSASERRTTSEVAHKWARWLHDPCRLGVPFRFRPGEKITSRSQMGKVAT